MSRRSLGAVAMNRGFDIPEPRLSVYQQIPFARDTASAPGGLLAKLGVYLPDQPGSLASFASAIAQAEGNISFFHYDRSLDSGRVAADACFPSADFLEGLSASLEGQRFLACPGPAAEGEIFVTAAESVLGIKVRLANQAGSLLYHR